MQGTEQDLEFTPPSSAEEMPADQAEFQQALAEALDAPTAEEPEEPQGDEVEQGKADAENPVPEDDPAPVEDDKADTDAEGVEAKSEEEKDDEDDDEKEVSEKDLKGLSEAQLNRRFSQIARQRAKFKRKALDLEENQTRLAQAAGLDDISKLTPEYLSGQREAAAGLYDLQNFMGENNLMPADVQTGMTAMAAITAGDWKTFMGIVEPYLDIARAQTGQGTLPSDLQQAVDRGDITEDFAKRYAQDRIAKSESDIKARRADAQQSYQATQSRQMQTQQQAQTANIIRAEIANWEQQTAQTDPDFSHKGDLIKTLLSARVARSGEPRDPQTAVKWATEAHAQATDMLRKAQPAPQRTTPPSAQPTPSTPRVQPKAETFEQMMEQRLANAG
jgi:hypothetical protein